MIKILVENEEFTFYDIDDCSCNGSAEFIISDEAVCSDAVFTFSKALEFAGYMKSSIKSSFEEVADNMTDYIEVEYKELQRAREEKDND